MDIGKYCLGKENRFIINLLKRGMLHTFHFQFGTALWFLTVLNDQLRTCFDNIVDTIFFNFLFVHVMSHLYLVFSVDI